MNFKLFLLALFTLMLSALASAQIDCPYVLTKYKTCLKTRNPDACSRILMTYYTAGTNYDLNSTLRGLTSPAGCAELAPLVKNVFADLPKSSLTVYRGMGLIPQLAKLKVGECFSDKGLTSTSSRVDVAQNFAGGALLVIAADSAISIGDFSAVKRESEYILLPNTALKLEKIPVKLEDNFVFELREVKKSECAKKS